ncbi:hypothetical protein GC169_06335 [bacterium]|nr:hypothetical protein [bacterium]
MRGLDAAALYVALDAERRRRGLSWSAVGREIGVAPNTMTRLKAGGRMEVDGMLAMVGWLGRSVEDFVVETPF